MPINIVCHFTWNLVCHAWRANWHTEIFCKRGSGQQIITFKPLAASTPWYAANDQNQCLIMMYTEQKFRVTGSVPSLLMTLVNFARRVSCKSDIILPSSARLWDLSSGCVVVTSNRTSNGRLINYYFGTNHHCHWLSFFWEYYFVNEG